MYNLWNNKAPFPAIEETKEIKNIEHITVHTAIKGEYQFLLGSAIIKHKGTFYSSWGNSLRQENDNNTILAEKRSYDNGKTWTAYSKISHTDKGYGRSHGVYFEYNEKLYAFCPKAKFEKIDAYPDLKTEGYLLNERGEWDCIGIVLDDYFWPMCEPVILDDGTLLMAGLKSDTAEATVALCDGKDLTRWEMVVIPNPHSYTYWGETTVLKQNNKLIALVRSDNVAKCILVSESFDNGKTWSGLEESNFPISDSKMYGGTLSNGNNYIVFNLKRQKRRETLCIAIGKEQFDTVYVIRHGFDKPPMYYRDNEWCYPYAYEDKESNKLYVVYAKNKEDCELSIIPVEELSR